MSSELTALAGRPDFGCRCRIGSADHSARRSAPAEIPTGKDNPWPDIAALADPRDGALETVLLLLALPWRPGSIALG